MILSETTQNLSKNSNGFWTQAEPILKEHLRQFGLNPDDWNLVHRSDVPGGRHKILDVDICHRRDHSFRLSGRAGFSAARERLSAVYWQDIRIGF